MSLFEWVQDKARKAAYLESAKETIEQRVGSAFAEGVNNAAAESVAAELGPVSIDDIKTDEEIAFLAGEIAKQESESINWLDFNAGSLLRKAYCFTALDKLADSRLAKAISESHSFKGIMDGDYFLLTALQDKFEFRNDWVDERFKDKEFIIPFLFLSQVDYWFPISLPDLTYRYDITPDMMKVFQGEPNEERPLPEDAGVLDKLAVNFPDDILDFYRQMLPRGEWIKRSRIGMSLDNEFTIVKIPGQINSLPSVELLFTALYYRKIDPEKLFEFLNSLEERSTKCYVEETLRQIGKRSESYKISSEEGMPGRSLRAKVPATVEEKYIEEKNVMVGEFEIVEIPHTETTATPHFPDFVDASRMPKPRLNELSGFPEEAGTYECSASYSIKKLLDAVPDEKFEPNRILKWIRENSSCKDPMIVLGRVNPENAGRIDSRAVMGYYEEWFQEIYNADDGRTIPSRAEDFFSSLAEFLALCPKSQFDREFVSKYFSHCFGWDSTLGDADAKSLGKLARVAKAGKISFAKVDELYDAAMAEAGTYLESVIESLPDLAAEYPEEALKRFEELHERIFVWSMDNEQFYGQDSADWKLITTEYTGLDEIIKQNLKLGKAMGKSLKKTIEQNSKKPGFRALRQKYLRAYLCTEANTARLEKIGSVYSQENRAHPIPDCEIIDYNVQKHCRHLKPHQRRELADFLVDRPGFAKKHENLRMEGGYSSEEVIDITGDVVKTATTAQNEREDLVYSLEGHSERFGILEDNLLGEFGMFIPRKKGELIRLNDGMSLLILDDLRKRVPGQRIAEMVYRALNGNKRAPWHTKHKGHNAAMYNMFLLGFAHKCLTKAANGGNADFPESQYTTLTGIPHYMAIYSPLPTTSDNVYLHLMKTVDRVMIDKCGKIIDKFIDYAKGMEGKVVAIGDNKVLENMKNGYMHDFACVGWGLEIEDITYGLVEPKLGIPLTKIKDYICAYTTMRCMHDKEFAGEVLKGKEEEMLAMADAAALKSLSIYASCTRKRVEQMESGEIVPRRNYFIKAMEYMLNNGDFTVVGAA